MQPVLQGSAALLFGFVLTACFYEVPGLIDGSCEAADLSSSPDHCGACDHHCLGGSCTDSRCDPGVVASGQEAPTGLLLDATQIYWTSQGGGWVARADKLQLPSTVVLADMQVGAFDLAQDDAYVYWTNVHGDAVMKIAKADGMPELVASDDGPYAIAIDDQAVYWTVYREPTFDGFVRTRSKQGGDFVTLAQDPGILYDAVVEGDYLYWSNKSANAIKRVRKTGGSVEVIADALGGPRGLAFYNGALYWVEEQGAIQKWDGETVTQIGEAPDDLRDVAIDASGIFATSTFGLSIVRLPHDSSAIETLAQGEPNPHDIAIDESAVYWTNYGATTVMRLAR